MSIIAAYAVPHPPLAVPEVGQGRERGLSTIENFLKVATMIAEDKPETIVIITPHGNVYSDYINVSPGAKATGSLSKFGANKKYKVDYDQEFVSRLEEVCKNEGFPGGTLGEEDPLLDHGVLVPLHFINQKYKEYKLIRVSSSGLSKIDHYQFGMYLKEVSESLKRPTVIVASGDLSHRLKEDGPYGFAPEGPVLDEKICDALRTGDFEQLFAIDENLRKAGAECGLAGLMVMAGTLDSTAIEPKLLSYEDRFGVGYAIATFRPNGHDEGRDFLRTFIENSLKDAEVVRGSEDELVSLARQSIEYYTKKKKVMRMPIDSPVELYRQRAGAFVTIKKDGMLRGCIGTTEPTRLNLGEEIIHNAVSASAMDPRFPPIEISELPFITISVDVLLPPEDAIREDLNPKEYGVIVSKGKKRGLLLPDLAGVDTIEEQLKIACQKAGIDPCENYKIQRFQVVRHT
ncbi:MAG: AmmeMemoRadiSam system protein A [Anaerovoracaceae bacterium]|jgi:AmmeMemoRadiSam system protein A/AmmeMemoRadiSam system protein B